MDDPALFMPHLEFTQNLGLTPGLGWVGETSLAHRARDVSPKGGHASQATPVAALAPHPCSRAIHPSIQPLAVPPCARGLPCGPIGVTENLRRKPRATGYLHLSPMRHAALSPASLKHPATAPRKHPRRAESLYTNPAAPRDGIPSPLSPRATPPSVPAPLKHPATAPYKHPRRAESPTSHPPPRATGYLHLYPICHAAPPPRQSAAYIFAPSSHEGERTGSVNCHRICSFQPRLSQAPRDRALLTPTPCGILPHKPSAPRDGYLSSPPRATPPSAPPLSSTPTTAPCKRPSRAKSPTSHPPPRTASCLCSPSINHAALILRDGSPIILPFPSQATPATPRDGIPSPLPHAPARPAVPPHPMASLPPRP